MNFESFRVPEGETVKLKNYPTDTVKPFVTHEDAAEKLQRDILKMRDLQTLLHAQDIYALLIVLQGIDGAGKDSTIKHVMSGMNPTACRVTSFKAPSDEELDHDYLWRHARALPERGQIGIFNRSHYEEVLVVRVHPELLAKERIKLPKKLGKLWADRYREINQFEQYLVDNGIVVLKFFLHLSKGEQKKRFLARLDRPDKVWKFSAHDVDERQKWEDYRQAFEDVLSHTSTHAAPWYVVPADNKWFTHVVVADVIVSKLKSLDLRYPTQSADQLKEIERARQTLLNE